MNPKTYNQKAAAGSDLLQLVSFEVAGEEFGLEILKVQEIIRMQDLTRVPNSPTFVEGVINLRGKVIPVIGLRKRFRLGAKEDDSRTRVVVAEVNGSILGFVVDAVSEVLRVAADTVEPAPRLSRSKVERDYVAGVVKLEGRLLILLDFDKLMSETEQAVCEEIAAV